MVARQGFQYEINAVNILKPMGLVPTNFMPAGASHDQPDLMLLYKGVEAGCELKISAASAGSLVLKYDISNKANPWKFSDIKQDDVEKIFIRDLATKVGFFKIVNQKWNEVPFKRDKDALWEATAGKLTPRKRYERDLSIFKDIKGEIPASEIEQYYNRKKTYYVNVGTHGFYLFGTQNPLRLNGVQIGRAHV